MLHAMRRPPTLGCFGATNGPGRVISSQSAAGETAPSQFAATQADHKRPVRRLMLVALIRRARERRLGDPSPIYSQPNGGQCPPYILPARCRVGIAHHLKRRKPLHLRMID